MKTSENDDIDILDDLAITILPKAGFKEADLMETHIICRRAMKN